MRDPWRMHLKIKSSWFWNQVLQIIVKCLRLWNTFQSKIHSSADRSQVLDVESAYNLAFVHSFPFITQFIHSLFECLQWLNIKQLLNYTSRRGKRFPRPIYPSSDFQWLFLTAWVDLNGKKWKRLFHKVPGLEHHWSLANNNDNSGSYSKNEGAVRKLWAPFFHSNCPQYCKFDDVD